MAHGWAVASPVFQEQYNGELTGNDLVFNNAAVGTEIAKEYFRKDYGRE